MASMTRLRRRLLRWNRYADRIGHRSVPGRLRAVDAVLDEACRRTARHRLSRINPDDRYWPAEAYDAHARRLL